MERYAPSMIHPGRSIRAQDRYLNFVLMRAPITDVTEATGGIMRATANGTCVTKDDVTPPPLFESLPDGNYDYRARALVSNPAGADVVLVEFNLMHDLSQALSMMLPKVEVLSFRSNFQAKNCYCHQFRVYRAGQITRHVDADCGERKSGVSFLAQGTPHTTETPEHYEARAVSKKFNRTLMLEIARKNWLDVEGALFGRALENATAFTGVEGLEIIADLVPLRQRTTDYASAYERAVRLGIGEGEAPISDTESQNAFMRRVEETQRYSERFQKALDRAKPDPAKAQTVYDEWMVDPERPEDFQIYRGALTQGLDPKGDANSLVYMQGEQAIWDAARDWDGRITQTIVDQIDDAEGIDKMYFAPSRAVMGVKSGLYPDIENAMRTEMGKIFDEIGIRFDPKGPLLGAAAAERSCMKQMGLERQSWNEKMNGVTSPFSLRTVVLTQDDSDDLT